MSGITKNKISINIKEENVYVPFFKDGVVSAGFGTHDFSNDCNFLPFKKQDLRLMFGSHSTAKSALFLRRKLDAANHRRG
ncbi:hypothetical protein [Campylobacter lanienae]|uniref:hypothetical protein n=1 Tax=Campylobacter lanienae TaxID=75658 RepID=UPI0024309F55|nr:hypothetical protein [Campylobacter lanienae]MDD5785761.1 hypothetical protein [Campylobacter lanienae]